MPEAQQYDYRDYIEPPGLPPADALGVRPAAPPPPSPPPPIPDGPPDQVIPSSPAPDVPVRKIADREVVNSIGERYRWTGDTWELVGPPKDPGPGRGAIGPGRRAIEAAHAASVRDMQRMQGQGEPSGGKEAIAAAVAQEWAAAGYPPAAVQGIMRRINVESGFDPFAIGDNGTSLSLYQHHADRAQRLAKFLQANGVSDTSDPVRMARLTTRFAIQEMNGGDPIAARHKAELLQAKDPNAAYGIFTSSFERPAGSPGSEETNLRSNVFGKFTGEAGTLVQQMTQRMQRADQEHDRAIAEAKDLHSFERAMTAKFMAESDKPPQNMRQAWSQWGMVAGALALFGGLRGGRSMNAAINAAGEMMQAANAADRYAYEQAYKQWSDHLGHGIKAIELIHREAKDILDRKDLSYDQMAHQLDILGKALGAKEKLDPDSVYNLKQKADKLKALSEIADANVLEGAIAEKVAQYKRDNGVDPPDSLKTKWRGDAKAELKGTAQQNRAAAQKAIYDSTYAASIAAGDDDATARLKAGRAAGYVPGAAQTQAKGREEEVSKEVDRRDKEWAAKPENANATADQKQAAHFENRKVVEQEMALATARSATGKLDDDQAKFLAQQYIRGNYAVITQLPRSGPGRIQVENEIGKLVKEMPDAAQAVTMNHLRMTEAESAARTAGRVTIQTELYSQEAAIAGAEVIARSNEVPRTELPTVNAALQAFERGTGDPKIIRFGASLNALVNAYGKMSNPTGTGIHDADKARFAVILDTALSKGQIREGVDQVIREGRIMSSAAESAQRDVLARIMPGSNAQPMPAPLTELPPGNTATPAPTFKYDAQGNRVP